MKRIINILIGLFLVHSFVLGQPDNVNYKQVTTSKLRGLRDGITVVSPTTFKEDVTFDSIRTTGIITDNLSADYISTTYIESDTILVDTVYTKSVILGNVTNEIILDTTSHLKFTGTQTYWDDITFPATQLKSVGVADKPDFDKTNLGLLFPQNDTTESVGLICHIPHGVTWNSKLYPHVHYIQTGANAVTWGIKYMLIRGGVVVPSTWTVDYATDRVFTYTSGSIEQISSFNPIQLPSSFLSPSLLVILYRKDNTTTGDVRLIQFDIHCEFDMLGSRQEFIK